MAEFRPICRRDDLNEGRGHPVEVDGLSIALFLDSGAVFALQGRCPHANGPMGRGWVVDGEAICPLHRWRFKLSTGRCTTAPGRSLHRFACEVRDDGFIWVAV